MKGYVSKYEKAVSLAKDMFGDSIPDWQMKNAIKHFFVQKLIPGATIGAKSVNGQNHVIVKKLNGREYTYVSKF